MIILPDTPPLAESLTFRTGALNPQLISTRASLVTTTTRNNNELVRDIVKLEQYLEELFKYARIESGSNEMSKILQFCCNYVISDSGEVPWTNIIVDTTGEIKKKIFGKVLNKYKDTHIQWSLLNEIEAVIISTSLIYTKLGSVLIK